MNVYRIKSKRTGMYYSRTGWVKNPLYNKAMPSIPSDDDYYIRHEKLEQDDFEEAKKLATEYNRSWFTCRFSPLGDIFYSRRGAEQILTRITKTNKKTRSTKAGIILHGTEKANIYTIVESKLVDTDET